MANGKNFCILGVRWASTSKEKHDAARAFPCGYEVATDSKGNFLRFRGGQTGTIYVLYKGRSQPEGSPLYFFCAKTNRWTIRGTTGITYLDLP